LVTRCVSSSRLSIREKTDVVVWIRLLSRFDFSVLETFNVACPHVALSFRKFVIVIHVS